MTTANPLMTYHGGFPPFATTRAEHFGPALEATTAAHLAEIDAIATNPATATFANTIEAMDLAGEHLGLVSRMFSNLTLSETSPELQAVEREWSPKLAAHDSRIYLNSAMFERVDTLHSQRADMGLDAESLRMLERVHLDFVRAGAKLVGAQKTRYAEIVESLATLYTTFSQNVLADESAWTLALLTEADLAGLPAFVRESAASAAKQRGIEALGVVTLSRSLVVPFLTFSSRRDLRKHAYTAWVDRGGNPGEFNNWPIASKIMALRHELATLHGVANYSVYQLADTMAQTPQAVFDLLQRVWVPAKALAQTECEALKGMAASLGQDASEVAPWDWRFYAEKVRQARFALDDAQVKPYFSLARMTQAMFDVAHRLFGIEFRANAGYAPYVADVTSYDVIDSATGREVAIFLADNFSRQTKRGGAWMSDYRSQRGGAARVLPIIVNNNNFTKAPQGQATLLGADDVRTLFHEFGHGLHGMLSQVRFQRLAGTSVLRDFVELPSQLFEHWAFTPEVLAKHARHVDTGAEMPSELMAKIHAARRFNQGFEAVEYTSCALVDLALHQRADAGSLDLAAFQADALASIGMPTSIRMRHHLPHFGHLFSGDGYASQYYVYLWAETLDADAFGAFTEARDPFDAATAKALLTHIYSAGNSVEPGATYRAFRGRNPDVNAMLRKKGLLAEV